MSYLLPLLTVLIWAGNTLVTKASAGAIGPSEIGFYRWLLAALLFTPFLILPVWRNRAAIKPVLGKVIVLAALGMALFQSLAYFAAGITSATNMAIIPSLIPIMALLMASAVLGSQLTWGALIGALISVAGVLEVVSVGHIGNLAHQGLNLGDAMLLLAALAFAVYSILLRKWQLRLPPLQLLYLQAVAATIMLLPMFLLTPRVGLNMHNIALVLYAGIPTSMLAPLLWMQSIARLGPERTTLFFNLLPIVTVVAAALILGEQLASFHLFGGSLTLAGVILAERWRTPLRPVALQP
jgi:drug/metabolite transporter (DMT)-like permease